MSRLTTDLNILRRPAALATAKEGLEISRVLVDFIQKHNKHAEKVRGKRHISRGIGLAAPQLGIHKRVFIYWTGIYYQPVVNPVLVEYGGGFFRHNESCLSFAGVFTTNVPRFNRIKMTADNLLKPIEVSMSGPIEIEDPKNTLLVACLQHEYQHCLGLTLHDAASPDLPLPDGWEEYARTRPVELSASEKGGY